MNTSNFESLAILCYYRDIISDNKMETKTMKSFSFKDLIDKITVFSETNHIVSVQILQGKPELSEMIEK